MHNEKFQELKKWEGKRFSSSRSMAGRWLQYHILSVQPGDIRVRLRIRKAFSNPLGHMHGGVIALLADEICGLCFYSMGLDPFYTTIGLHIDYLFGAPVGTTVTARARVLRSGKRMANVEFFLYDATEQLLAHATTNLMNSGTKILPIAPSET